MNAGAYGGEMAQVIDSVTVLFPDEGIKTLSCADMAFGYRHSLLMEHPGAVVLHAEFALEKDDSAAIRSRMDDLMSRRRASQPLEYPSAGSTFKRPEGYFAGRLIEEAGCKGLTVGGAQVSNHRQGQCALSLGGRGHAPGRGCPVSRRGHRREDAGVYDRYGTRSAAQSQRTGWRLPYPR